VTVDDAGERLELGTNIRSRRSGAGLTMSALADAAGVSQSLISQIERGLAEPSLSTLRRIAADEERADGRPQRGGSGPVPATSFREQQLVVRREHRKQLKLPESDVHYELLVPDLGRRLEVIQAAIPARSRVPTEPSLHVGEETIVCLAGEVVCVHGEEEYVLGPGDALTWDAATPHWVENRTDVAADVIAVITPPNL
jgi:transcriptional regulator with XRE-family HTH domain